MRPQASGSLALNRRCGVWPQASGRPLYDGIRVLYRHTRRAPHYSVILCQSGSSRFVTLVGLVSQSVHLAHPCEMCARGRRPSDERRLIGRLVRERRVPKDLRSAGSGVIRVQENRSTSWRRVERRRQSVRNLWLVVLALPHPTAPPYIHLPSTCRPLTPREVPRAQQSATPFV